MNIGLAKQPRTVLLKVTWLASLMEIFGLKWNIILLDSTPGCTKGGSISVLLTSCLIVFESAAWQLTIYIFIFKTDLSKQVKQEVNCRGILPTLVFPEYTHWPRVGNT